MDVLDSFRSDIERDAFSGPLIFSLPLPLPGIFNYFYDAQSASSRPGGGAHVTPFVRTFRFSNGFTDSRDI
jgi:hypothetical protein